MEQLRTDTSTKRVPNISKKTCPKKDTEQLQICKEIDQADFLSLFF